MHYPLLKSKNIETTSLGLQRECRWSSIRYNISLILHSLINNLIFILFSGVYRLLETFKLKTNMLVGLGTDGASVMVGQHNGVHAKIVNQLIQGKCEHFLNQ